MLRFEDPIYLWLLWMLPVLVLVRFIGWRRRRAKLRKFGDPELLKALMPNVSSYRPTVKFGLLLAALALLILMVALKDWVLQVRVIALVAIMVMVSAETFDWKSLGALVRHPRLSSAAMLATVAVTIATHNLAAGVAVGVVLSGVFFAFKVSRMLDVRMHDDAQTGQRTWRVSGQVFFASADAFIEAFDVLGAEGRAVIIDVTHAHFWDITAVAALDKVVERLRHHGCTVEVLGLNTASAVLMERAGAR